MKSIWISDEAWQYVMKIKMENPQLGKTMSQLVSDAILNNVEESK